MDRLSSMAIFVRVAELGGFAAVAAETGLSATTIGNHIRALEDRLNARLIQRTTRRQSLTELGRVYHERCRRILAEVEAAETWASEMQRAPRGNLRITAPVSFGTMQLVPALADYLATFPEVSIDLVLNDRVVDLVDEGFEAAIRIGKLSDSTFIARKLRPYRWILCASPSYLARAGMPGSAEELANHACLGFTQASVVRPWKIGAADMAPQGKLSVNSGPALREAALAGLGIIQQPEALLAADVERGDLVRLLPDAEMPSAAMHLIYLPDRRLTPKLKSFIDFVSQRFPARS